MEPTKTPTRTKRRERTLAFSLLKKTTRTKAKTAALAATTNGDFAPRDSFVHKLRSRSRVQARRTSAALCI
jgi:hypothetical protein